MPPFSASYEPYSDIREPSNLLEPISKAQVAKTRKLSIRPFRSASESTSDRQLKRMGSLLRRAESSDEPPLEVTSSDTVSLVSGNSSRISFSSRPLHRDQKGLLASNSMATYRNRLRLVGSIADPILSEQSEEVDDHALDDPKVVTIRRQWSDMLFPPLEEMSLPSINRFGIIQASDDDLDSAGLTKTIAEVIAEKQRLVAQFAKMETASASRLRDNATKLVPLRDLNTSHNMGRRASTSTNSLRPSSLLSTSFQEESTMRMPIITSSHRLSRRPSLSASVTTSSSSSLSRHQLLSDRGGDTHPTSSGRRASSVLQDLREELTLPPCSFISVDQLDPVNCRELEELKKGRMQIEERYEARLEYLEAKLRARLIQDKLRR